LTEVDKTQQSTKDKYTLTKCITQSDYQLIAVLVQHLGDGVVSISSCSDPVSRYIRLIHCVSEKCANFETA